MQSPANASLFHAPSAHVPYSPKTSSAVPLRHRTHMDRVERDLLQEIQRIQSKLGQIRQQQSRTRRHPNQQNHHSFSSASSSSRCFANDFSPPNRVISVSLRLPRNGHHTSARQQLFDAAIPPKAVLSLPDASNYPFIWVGSDPPGINPDSDDVVLVPTSMHLHQRHLRRRRKWRDANSPGTTQGRSDASGSGKNDSNLSNYDGDDDDDDDDEWEFSHPYYPIHRNVHVDLPEDPDVLRCFQCFCEDVLWRLLHYDYNAVDNPDLMVYWSAYREVNQRFAESVAENCEDGDIIWIHNYHLMLLPALLRDLVPHARIGFFLYTPFPSSELFRILPYRMEILRGVVGADVIGFHSYDHAKQFVTSARRHLPFDTTPNEIIDPLSGRKTKIGIYPSGIDADTLRSHVSSKLVKSRVAELRLRFEGVKVVVGVDRLDDCFSGLLHKLLAFELMLSENPELVGKVVLVQAAMLPKQARSLSTYREQREQLNKCVARVNSSYGSWSYSPIHFINSPLDPTELHALMCVGHVLVVSTVRDGMGLVPHEWTVCQHGAYNGPIVLSEFSSAAHSFSTALHVNPWDIDEVAAKIKVALDMGDASRHVRNEAAYRFVTTHTAQQWGSNFLEDVDNVQRPALPHFYRRQQQQRQKQHQLKNQAGQQHQQHQDHSNAGSTSASLSTFSSTSPTALKPALDTDALVHAYLGTTKIMPTAPPPPPPPPSLSLSAGNPHVLSSSPPFAYGDHISRIARASSHANMSMASPLPFSTTDVAGTVAEIISNSNNMSGFDSGGRSNANITYPASQRSFDSSAADVPDYQFAMQSSSSILGNGPILSSTRRIDEMLSVSGPNPSPGLAFSTASDAVSVGLMKRARACLFIIDIEGTLVSSEAEKRDIPPSAIDIIQDLVDASPHNNVLVISSHGRDALLRSFGDMRVYIAAEDGAFFRSPGSSSWSLLFRDSAMSGSGASANAGKRHSPGNTVHGNDQYTPPTKLPANGDEDTMAKDPSRQLTSTLQTGEPSESATFCAALNKTIGHGDDPSSKICDNESKGNSGESNLRVEANHDNHNESDPVAIAKGSTSAMSPNSTASNITTPTSASATVTTPPTGSATASASASTSAAPTSKASMSTHTSFSSVELGYSDGGVMMSWKESVMQVLHHFAERTAGVVVHEGEATVTWEYGRAEFDHGHWQSKQVHKHLESFMLRGVSIGVVSEEGATTRRWIRVRPAEVDKAKAVLRFFKEVSSNSTWPHDEFDKDRDRMERDKEKDREKDNDVARKNANVTFDLIACFGDDRADEPMFELLHDRRRLENAGVVCSPRSIFTCKVGKQVGRTAAAACLNSPQDVMQLLKTICGKHAWPVF